MLPWTKKLSKSQVSGLRRWGVDDPVLGASKRRLLETSIFLCIFFWKIFPLELKFVDCVSSRILKHWQSSEQTGHHFNQVRWKKCFKDALKHKFKWHSTTVCCRIATAAARPPGSNLWLLSSSAIRQIWFVAVKWWCQKESKGGL